MGNYTVVYSSDFETFSFLSDSKKALAHLKERFANGGNDTVSVYDTERYDKWDGNPNAEPLVSKAMYSSESGGRFYRCNI